LGSNLPKREYLSRFIKPSSCAYVSYFVPGAMIPTADIIVNLA
jgi:hypothetical protein